MYTEFCLRRKSEKNATGKTKKRSGQNKLKVEIEDGSWIELANKCV